jgi:hypothetical protein
MPLRQDVQRKVTPEQGADHYRSARKRKKDFLKHVSGSCMYQPSTLSSFARHHECPSRRSRVLELWRLILKSEHLVQLVEVVS